MFHHNDPVVDSETNRPSIVLRLHSTILILQCYSSRRLESTPQTSGQQSHIQSALFAVNPGRIDSVKHVSVANDVVASVFYLYRHWLVVMPFSSIFLKQIC